MDQSAELLAAFRDIETEKGIDKEVLFEAIETSLLTACRKHFGTSQNIKVSMDRETGKVQVFAQKTVVDEVTDAFLEISLDDAQKINPSYNIGDVVDVAVTPKNFGRISAQSAKQVVIQKIREAERGILFKEYKEKEREAVTGIVQRFEKRNVIISLGKLEAIMPHSEQIRGEQYSFNDRIKVYVLDVKDTPKGPQISVSRTHPEFVKRLFENEVPEIYDGTVEIKSISREAGSRTKIAVHSKNPNVEAVGACVGQNGYRVNIVVKELKGEKIDIINWSDDPKKFITAALSPAKAVTVVTDIENRSAKIIVPDYQLSLAIGREGQNARLAAKLTGFRIDIKSESQARETSFITEDDFARESEQAKVAASRGGYYEEALEGGEYDEEYYDAEYYEDDGYYDDEEYDDEYYDDEEYDDEYYDDEYYDDEEYDDEEYDDEYYDDEEYGDGDDSANGETNEPESGETVDGGHDKA